MNLLRLVKASALLWLSGWFLLAPAHAGISASLHLERLSYSVTDEFGVDAKNDGVYLRSHPTAGEDSFAGMFVDISDESPFKYIRDYSTSSAPEPLRPPENKSLFSSLERVTGRIDVGTSLDGVDISLNGVHSGRGVISLEARLAQGGFGLRSAPDIGGLWLRAGHTLNVNATAMYAIALAGNCAFDDQGLASPFCDQASVVASLLLRFVDPTEGVDSVVVDNLSDYAYSEGVETFSSGEKDLRVSFTNATGRDVNIEFIYMASLYGISQPSPIPEASTAAMWVLGVMSLFFACRRSRRVC